MKIETYALPQPFVEKETKGRTFIVIDCLRATSCIITALENGCREIVPTAEVDEAVMLARTLNNSRVRLCGERSCEHIPGFDLDNSPLTYTRSAVEDCILVMTTTNGTRAILHARDASVVLLGGFLNASAITQAALKSGNDITLLCAGTKDRYSTDDIVCAGAIINRLLHACPNAQTDDLSSTAAFLYKAYREGQPLLEGTAHYATLHNRGYQEDIRFCLREDVMSAVPFYKDGIIRLMPEDISFSGMPLCNDL